MRPLSKVKITWSPDFAYAIGLITTDGSLSKDERHISFTSKDLELIRNLLYSLRIHCHIGRKASSSQPRKKYYTVQIGDVLFYNFLLSIGLMPNKTKIVGALHIPEKYFFDFLRGHLDGDGTFYSYWDPRWKFSFMFYTVFASASKGHILWLRDTILRLANARGHITKAQTQSCYQLKYAKSASLRLLKKLYYSSAAISLIRKHLKIKKALAIIGESL
ncbi:LAGLIDADG family homing endonuclease [Candidatus Peregrinibacteria bacterium]|nr:LAGLIDADG family homing endonuclease [Candidatus Peregrinibacteria bacterium]